MDAMAKLWATVCLVIAAAALTWAADQVVVEDWAKIPVGTKGLPPDWKAQSWGSPKYDFAVVENDGKRVLNLKSRDEGSTIAKEIKGKVDLKATPILEWSWRAVTLPKGGNSCKKATDDQAAQVYVAWRRFPEALRSRIVGYVWDTTAAVGTICKSEKTSTVTYVVLRSGPGDLGKWIVESRNIVEDFRRIYGEEPESPDAVSISIDTNDTASVAESFVGAILFRK
jgi:hypothetical protein